MIDIIKNQFALVLAWLSKQWFTRPPPTDSSFSTLFWETPGLHRLFPDDLDLRLGVVEHLIDRGEQLSVIEAELKRLGEIGAGGSERVIYVSARLGLKQNKDMHLIYASLRPLVDSAKTLAFLNLAINTAWTLKEHGEVRRILGRLNEIDSGNVQGLGGASAIFGTEGQFEQGLRYALKAVELDPRSPLALPNLVLSLRGLGRHADHERVHRKLVATINGPVQRYHLGCCLIGQKKFAEGWSLHENREPFLVENRFRPGWLERPRWKGESLAGKRLLVFCEQGAGDTIMVARYFAMIKERVGYLIIECSPYQRDLMSCVDGVDEAIAGHYTVDPDVQCDSWVLSMSLPYIFGAAKGIIYAPTRYLAAPADLLDFWQDRVPQDGKLNIGIAWAGNAIHTNDFLRSMPVEALLPLCRSSSQWRFHQLCMNPVPNEIASLGCWVDPTSDLLTFSDTAALIETLDLVISVDTSVAHLAGALGRQTWIALPYAPEWRWFDDQNSSSWYPTSRLFRQDSPGDWGSVIAKILEALTIFTSNATSSAALTNR